MKAHELAKLLLAAPDLDVIGKCVGQGGNEYGDEPLAKVTIKATHIELEFFA